MTTRPCLAALALTALLVACAGGPVPADPAQTAPPSAPSAAAPGAPAPPDGSAGIYRADQAERGRALFRDRCSECHYSSEMRGTQFQFEWERRTVGDLYEHLVETMPEDAPGSLTPAEYAEVVSYILELNGFPPGSDDLRPGAAAFQTSLEAPSGVR